METFAYAGPAVLPAGFASMSAAWAAPAAALPIPQVHQIQDQVELMLTVVAPNGIEETSGVAGTGVPAALKRRDVRGVPPRGRPV